MTFFGDVIAGERDDVGLKTVCRLDSALDLFGTRKRAVMNIRELHDAKAVEGFRQPVQLDSLVLDAEHVGLGECGTSDMRQAKREGAQWRVWLCGTAIGHDTSALVPSKGSSHIFLDVDWRQPAGEAPRRGRIIETSLSRSNLRI